MNILKINQFYNTIFQKSFWRWAIRELSYKIIKVFRLLHSYNDVYFYVFWLRNIYLVLKSHNNDFRVYFRFYAFAALLKQRFSASLSLYRWDYARWTTISVCSDRSNCNRMIITKIRTFLSTMMTTTTTTIASQNPTSELPAAEDYMLRVYARD